MSIILGLDPATRFGWAIRSDDGSMCSGAWNLKPGRWESPAVRWSKLRNNLDGLIANCNISLVVYEQVRRHLGTDAAHLYGGAVAVIQHWCEDNSIPFCGAPVGSVKKFATGKGNAKKEAMIAAANSRWGTDIADDNEADARWIAEYAAMELASKRLD